MSSTADLAIRLRRAEFNRALAASDLAAIGPLLAPAAVCVTGSDSAVITGRKAQLIVWKREFSAPDRTVYTRTPDAVIVSAVEPIALENGHWQGVGVRSGQVLASGIYSAKWRRTGADWVIEAEIYVTMD